MSWQKNLQNQNGGENYDLDCHTFQSFFSVIILFDSIPLHPSNHNPTNLWKEKSTMCFCYKTVVCNFCSGDDNVHEPICTKTIFYCKSHTHRHKHQDLVKKPIGLRLAGVTQTYLHIFRLFHYTLIHTRTQMHTDVI